MMPANEALLLVDVVANLDHPDGAELEQAIRHAQPNLVRAEAHARRHGIPIIFANDALDDWTGDRDALITRRLSQSSVLQDLPLPRNADAFVVKPRYSAFDHTPIDLILEGAGVTRIVLAGTATEMCIAQTAIDARELGFQVTVLEDACAATDDRLAQIALEYLHAVVGARITPTQHWTQPAPQRDHAA